MRRLLAAFLIALGATTTAAVASTAAAPPKGSVSGHYILTFKVTNTKAPNSVFDVRVLASCAAPCTTFRTAERLKGETTDRGKPRAWTWKADKGWYRYHHKKYKTLDCAGKTKDVKGGYDGDSTLTLTPTKVVAGRVVAFKGTGRDFYLPNKAGKAAGCEPGAYTFVITGKAI